MTAPNSFSVHGRLMAIILFFLFSLQVEAQFGKEIIIDEDLQLISLEDSLYIHVSWHFLPAYGRIPSNGLLLIKNGEALLVDTPMDNAKTERLTDYIRDSLKARPTTLIIGHSHDDCMGGLAYLQTIGVESIASKKTIEKCIEGDLPVPSKGFEEALELDFYGEMLECRYFGPGHAVDNITVWLPGRGLLFGGCLIKSRSSVTLNNLPDSDIERWDETVNMVRETYPEIRWVIPGHGAYAGTELLSHTIELVKTARQKKESE